MNKGPFPFHTITEAWDYFDRAARLHFIRLIRQEMSGNPKIKKQAEVLANKDYCARLLYILNMFAYEGDQSGEFDLDWAMVLAKPLSASQARRSIDDLIEMGLMTKVENIERRIRDTDVSVREVNDTGISETNKRNRKGPGGKTNSQTQFDFD